MKTVLITGANAGIGFATARYLAARDWHVLLACRSESKAKAAIAAIRNAHPDARLGFVPLDLFSMNSVRRVPEELAAMRVPVLSGLILNAGGFNKNAKSLEFSEDGFERTFQLNFLGHFLLANLLVKQMTESARIIFVSSDLHDPAATKMGKLMPPKYGPVEDMARGTGAAAKLKPMARYGTAKMYAMMTAYELDRRLRKTGNPITVNSWSPGVVPTTQAARDMNLILKTIIMSRWLVNFMGSHRSTEEEAAQALCGLLIDSKYSGVSGSTSTVSRKSSPRSNRAMRAKPGRSGSKAPNSPDLYERNLSILFRPRYGRSLDNSRKTASRRGEKADRVAA